MHREEAIERKSEGDSKSLSFSLLSAFLCESSVSLW